jgi:membrane protease YdiL (CAAX protease family)
MAATDSFIAEEANPDLAWIIEVNAAFLTYILVFVLSLALALLVGKGPRDFGFSLPYHSLPWLLAVTGLALLFIPIRMTLVIFLALLFDPGGLFRTNEEGGGIFSTDETALVAIAGLQLLIMIAIFAPVVEEFIFRGILQPWLRHQFGRAVSIVGSGVLFGLAHQETYLVISNIVMGLVIAAVYERTGSLWLAMWLHFVNNFTVVCLLVLALLLVAMAG